MTTQSAILPYDDLIWVCTNLCELLEVENEALLQHDAQSVRELAANKLALSNLYERSMLPMTEDPQLVEALDPDQKDELKTLGARLAQLVAANAMMLRAEMEACQRVLDAMVTAAKELTTSTVAYGARGRFEIAHLGSERNALALNRTL